MDIVIDKKIIQKPDGKSFPMHNHKDALEVLIYIRGDAEYFVEGSVYKLKPYDTIIAADNEMHKIVHKSASLYERIVINVSKDFFVQNNCEKYAGLFYARLPGVNNLIPYELTKDTYFRNCIDRLIEYNEEKDNDILLRSVIIELLHILNKCQEKSPEKSIKNNKYINDVIMYINQNLTNDISLESISEHFFVNKSYLCRIFKKHTGYTLNKYITHKRIMYVRELCAKNMSISQASIEAGFGNYSNFYKMYVKETGIAPSAELK